jgi:hypothetical protein
MGAPRPLWRDIYVKDSSHEILRLYNKNSGVEFFIKQIMKFMVRVKSIDCAVWHNIGLIGFTTFFGKKISQSLGIRDILSGQEDQCACGSLYFAIQRLEITVLYR